MNEVEKLLWALDPTGNAESYTLTKAQLEEIVEASVDSGWEQAEDFYEV